MRKIALAFIIVGLLGLLSLGYVMAHGQQTVHPIAQQTVHPIAKSPSAAKSPDVKAAAPMPEVAPTIPASDLKDYFKAQVALDNALAASQNAQALMKQVIGKLTDDCGTKAAPIINPTTNEPICQLKPPMPAAPPAVPAK